MDEINKILKPNEKILWKGKPRFLPYLFNIIFIGLFSALILGAIVFIFSSRNLILSGIFFISVFIIFLFGGFWSLKKIEYVITNKNIILFQDGHVEGNFKIIKREEIKRLRIINYFFGLIFKTGTIEIDIGEMQKCSGYSYGWGIIRMGGKWYWTGYGELLPKYYRLMHIKNPHEVYRLINKK